MLVKGLVAKLVPVYAQNAWKSMVQIAELTTCCNYLKKKKKTKSVMLSVFLFFWRTKIWIKSNYGNVY